MFTELKPLLILLPMVLMATMQRTAMSSTSMPYSSRAAPSSSLTKLRAMAVRRFMRAPDEG